MLITKDARGNDSDQGSASDQSDHGDRDNDGNDCRRSVVRAPRDGGTWKDQTCSFQNTLHTSCIAVYLHTFFYCSFGLAC